jgi:hypothetical protein
MKFQPGDLVYCRVLSWMRPTFNGKVGTIREGGHDDLCPRFNLRKPIGAAFVEWARPVLSDGVLVRGSWMDPAILVKIGGPDLRSEMLRQSLRDKVRDVSTCKAAEIEALRQVLGNVTGTPTL